jgi:hypothetical protein
MKWRARTLALGTVLVFAASDCGTSPTGPTPGNLAVALVGAGASDHALLLEIAGADTSARIDTVQATTGSAYRVFGQRETASRWRVIVTGTLENGPLVEIGVPNKSRSRAYAGTVLDVADASFLELAPSGRTLTVSP